MKTGLSIVCLMLFLSFGVSADSKTFTVSGKIHSTSDAPIQVFLVDEEMSKKPFVGIDTLVINPNKKEISNGYIIYQFKNVENGIYGIRCFQDMNDNKKLDKGLFGPSEPWGLSWNENKTSRWPTFNNFSFVVNTDIKNIDIKLKK